MSGQGHSALLLEFQRFVRAHGRCGAFLWDTADSDDGLGVEVKAHCLTCEAKFLHFVTAAEVASDPVHSDLLSPADSVGPGSIGSPGAGR